MTYTWGPKGVLECYYSAMKSLHQKWLFGFALWLLFLSGTFAHLFGSPGILQAIRLKILLETKSQQLFQAKEKLRELHAEVQQLEHNRFTQEREIRRVLGYTAPDEMIFDFSAP